MLMEYTNYLLTVKYGNFKVRYVDTATEQCLGRIVAALLSTAGVLCSLE